MATEKDPRAPLLRTLLDNARADMARAQGQGAGGLAPCHAFSDALDAGVRALFQLAVREAGADPVALLATGGWGRRETCPYSDIDLLFLTAREPDDRVRALAERVLYPLWDSGLEVGHAVRSLDEAARLAREDLATATALLDARPLGGDDALAARLPGTLAGALAFAGDPNAFVRRVLDEKRGRHARFGDSVFLLEPNLKHGQGGLRDLASGLWAARARWRARDFADLLPFGQASARQVAPRASTPTRGCARARPAPPWRRRWRS